MTSPGAHRPPLFGLIFLSIFGFIGLTVLIFLWNSGDGFGAPPLFFKIFGSFIALAFMVMGFGIPLTAIIKGKSQNQAKTKATNTDVGTGYDCPNCGANILDAEVSPSGDVKCPFCKSWWNIHHG